MIKVIEFKDEGSNYRNWSINKTLEEWQKANPQIKIIDTKINAKSFIHYENILLVTYEEKEAETQEKRD